jgi:hypothetical protein
LLTAASTPDVRFRQGLVFQQHTKLKHILQLVSHTLIVTSDLAIHTQLIPSLPQHKEQSARRPKPHAGENAARKYMIQKSYHLTSLETGICHEKTAKPMILNNLQNGGEGSVQQ